MTLSKQVWNRLKRLKKSDFGLEEKVATRSWQKPLSVWQSEDTASEDFDAAWKSLDNEELVRFKEKKRRELDVLFGAKYADLEKELAAVKEENGHLTTTIKAIRTLVENVETKWWIQYNEK